jgi:hypothetical protein
MAILSVPRNGFPVQLTEKRQRRSLISEEVRVIRVYLRVTIGFIVARRDRYHFAVGCLLFFGCIAHSLIRRISRPINLPLL